MIFGGFGCSGGCVFLIRECFEEMYCVLCGDLAVMFDTKLSASFCRQLLLVVDVSLEV